MKRVDCRGKKKIHISKMKKMYKKGKANSLWILIKIEPSLELNHDMRLEM